MEWIIMYVAAGIAALAFGGWMKSHFVHKRRIAERLDTDITFWRERRRRAIRNADPEAETQANHYVDACQTMRVYLLGEALPPDIIDAAQDDSVQREPVR